MRKCIFLPASPAAAWMNQAAEAAPRVSPAALPQRAVYPQAPLPPEPPRQPKHNVRMMPAFVPHAQQQPSLMPPDQAELARRRAAFYADARNKLVAPKAQQASASWFEDPIALGTLLLLLPPIGLAALWSSKRYSSDARWALTVMTGLTLCLAAAITVAIIALRL